MDFQYSLPDTEEFRILAQEKLAADRDVAVWEARLRKAEAEKAERELFEYTAQSEYAKASNFRNRVYDFVSEVNLRTVEESIDVISRWARQGKDPITVRFTSPGGHVSHGFSLFDSIRMYVGEGIPVTTIAMGEAASMAAVLLQAGSKRIIGQNATFFLHEVSGGVMGDVSATEEHVTNMRNLNNRLVRILAERSTLKPNEIALKIKRKGWTLDADDCMKYGFADEVLKTPYKVRGK